MKKIKLIEKVLKNIEIIHEGQEISVIPYIDYNNQGILIKSYLSAYFKDGVEDRLYAETVNKIAVLDLLTNVDLEDIEASELHKLLDNMVSSGLWEKITKTIKNYREYLYNLDIALAFKKKEDSDIGFIFKKLIEEKVNPMIVKFSEIDFTDEKLEQVKSLVNEVKDKLNPDTPIGSLLSKGIV